MATRKSKINRMSIHCHAQLFNEFCLILVIMVTPASNKIQYHQIIKQIRHANITMYITVYHSVHWFYYLFVFCCCCCCQICYICTMGLRPFYAIKFSFIHSLLLMQTPILSGHYTSHLYLDIHNIENIKRYWLYARW